MAIAVPLMLGDLAWLLLNAELQTTAPNQMRFQAKSVLNNSLLAGLLVTAAGFFESRLDFGPLSNWALSLGVVGVCWIIAAAIWYGANKIEKNLAQTNVLCRTDKP